MEAKPATDNDSPARELICPECKRVCPSQGSLSAHRSKAHGWKPESRQSQRYYEKKEKGIAPTEKGKGNKRGPYKKHERAALTTREEKQLAGPPQTSNNSDASSIPESSLAVAFGRFLEFQKNLAAELDLPPRTFAREFARVISASTAVR